MLFEGQAQRFIQRYIGPVVARLTGLQSLAVAQVEGEGDEATRAGLRFYLGTSGATGIAPVQAVPTTAAHWMIWNPNGQTVTAFLDTLGMQLTSGTAGAGGEFYGAFIGPKFAPATVPTISTSSCLIQNVNPLSARQSNLICVSAQTLVNIAASNWVPLGAMDTIGTILGQTRMQNLDLKGKICIPPGCGLALAVVSPTGTSPLWAPYGSWREYATDLE